MQATARLIKAMYPDAFAYLSARVSRRRARLSILLQWAGQDYALTYEELYAMMEAKGVDPADYTGELQQGSKYGKNYSVSGGVTAAVLQTYKERNEDVPVKVCKATVRLNVKRH